METRGLGRMVDGTNECKGRWIDLCLKGRSKIWKARVVGREKERMSFDGGEGGIYTPDILAEKS